MILFPAGPGHIAASHPNSTPPQGKGQRVNKPMQTSQIACPHKPKTDSSFARPYNPYRLSRPS